MYKVSANKLSLSARGGTQGRSITISGRQSSLEKTLGTPRLYYEQYLRERFIILVGLTRARARDAPKDVPSQ